MKKVLISCLIIFVILLFSHTAIADFKRTKVAVLDFQVQGEQLETQDMGKIVAEWLITAMVKGGRFDIIERRLLEKILQEQQIEIKEVREKTSTCIIISEKAPNAISYSNMVRTILEPKVVEALPEKPKVEVSPERPRERPRVEPEPERPKVEVLPERPKQRPKKEEKERAVFPDIME